jgi:prepilin-type N-terminal cleavage/methylation domain-containing protein
MPCDNPVVGPRNADSVNQQVPNGPVGHRESGGLKRVCFQRGNGGGRGFTLVELLVVIAIIALLVSILLPALAKAKEHANRVVCITNMKNIILGMFYYSDDNDGEFPPINPNPVLSSYWNLALDEYLGGLDDSLLTANLAGKIWNCPSNPSPKDATGQIQGSWISYVMNRWMLPEHYLDVPLNKWDDVTSPSEKFLILERSFKGYPFPATMVGAWNYGPICGLADDTTGQLTPENSPHERSADIGFFDMHVETMPYDYVGFHLLNPDPAVGPDNATMRDAYVQRHWVPN